MTENERLVYKAYKSKGSLCWDCKKALWQCSWSAKFVPVDGWTAIRRDLRVAEGTKTESYFVLDCPEFVHDEVRDETD